MKDDVCYYRHAQVQGIVNFIINLLLCFVRRMKGSVNGKVCMRRCMYDCHRCL